MCIRDSDYPVKGLCEPVTMPNMISFQKDYDVVFVHANYSSTKSTEHTFESVFGPDATGDDEENADRNKGKKRFRQQFRKTPSTNVKTKTILKMNSGETLRVCNMCVYAPAKEKLPRVFSIQLVTLLVRILSEWIEKSKQFKRDVENEQIVTIISCGYDRAFEQGFLCYKNPHAYVVTHRHGCIFSSKT